MNRYFVQQPLTLGETLTLPPSVAKHALTVLRGQVGDELELVGTAPQAYVATITGLDPATVQVTRALSGQPELPVAVTIVCGIGKGDKAEWITQKATELGVSQLVFYNATWGTARWAKDRAPKKLARLAAIAAGAAAQSHRTIIPQIVFIPELAALPLHDGEARLVAYEESAKAGETAVLLQTLQQAPRELVTVFGPEGGISPAELAWTAAHGFSNAGLGPRILRTETAPLYLLSAVSVVCELQGEAHA